MLTFSDAWICSGGEWLIQQGEARQTAPWSGHLCEACLVVPSPIFTLEVSLKSLSEKMRSPGAYGLFLDGAQNEEFCLTFLPKTVENTATAMIATGSGDSMIERPLDLAGEFNPLEWHQIRIEVNQQSISLVIDEEVVRWHGSLASSVQKIGLFTRSMPAAFSEFQLRY